MIIEEDSSCVDDDSLLGSEKNHRGARIELSAISFSGRAQLMGYFLSAPAASPPSRLSVFSSCKQTFVGRFSLTAQPEPTMIYQTDISS